jgi:hypothetical protein
MPPIWCGSAPSDSTPTTPVRIDAEGHDLGSIPITCPCAEWVMMEGRKANGYVELVSSLEPQAASTNAVRASRSAAAGPRFTAHPRSGSAP